MKVRHQKSASENKIELQMTPMIDIVFQLLVFFILTFKVVAQEGDFNIRMPAMGAPQDSMVQPESTTLRVRMEADANGNLARMKLDNEVLSAASDGERASTLHARIRGRIDDGSGPNAAAAMMEVEFDCDYDLKYTEVIKAITAVSGYRSRAGNNDKIVKLIEKIKFAPRRKEKS